MSEKKCYCDKCGRELFMWNTDQVDYHYKWYIACADEYDDTKPVHKVEIEPGREKGSLTEVSTWMEEHANKAEA